MRTIKFLTLFLFFISLDVSGQGLMFNGMENSIDERTSYNVFKTRQPEFRDILRIEFSLSMYLPSDFGYVLRIKNNEDDRIFNILYSGRSWDSTCPFRLNEEGKSTILKADFPHDYIEMGKWMQVSLEFAMAASSAAFLAATFSSTSFTSSLAKRISGFSTTLFPDG